MAEQQGTKRSKKKLVDSVVFLSLLISTLIIIQVQIVSLFVINHFLAKDLNQSVAAEADQISAVLVEPLYNVDDDQARRIVETMLSSGRISGVRLVSSATGVLYEKPALEKSTWIKSQTREITKRGIYLGRIEIHFNDFVLHEIIQSVFTVMMLVLGALIIANFLANRFLIHNRVQSVFGSIIHGINEISRGNYEYRLKNSGYDDMDSIIHVINKMSDSIIRKTDELKRVNSGLEERVAARTKELELALNEQRLLQDRLVETGKLTALGQLSAGIAHELNTPLGAIQSSARSLTLILDRDQPYRVGGLKDLNDRERQLYDKILELGYSQNQKLNSQLPDRKAIKRAAASIKDKGIGNSDEIADSLADMGISESLDQILPLLETDHDLDMVNAAGKWVLARRLIEVINEASRKTASVISALRSHLSPQTSDEGSVIDLSEEISRVLTLMNNMLKYGVKVKTLLPSAKIRGSSDKLSQVWMNIIRNAAEAMDFHGTLEISLSRAEERVSVHFIDSGPGIPVEIQDKIFAPFFTTKKVGEGMGLGLDICKRIVQSQRGSIVFNSKPGRTEFIVSLPAAFETRPMETN